VSVVVSIVVLVVLAAWLFVVYNRLLRLREQVRDAWRRLEPQQEDGALRDAYNARVNVYNAALSSFPSNVVAMLAGFQAARRFSSTS
jgi:hypothetical protein